ncbi:MAG: PcfJ domain-containing protein [Robiginitomaculum sp.]|nr:PcfJ domain-containing protein [Robiginitomaculum sp.]
MARRPEYIRENDPLPTKMERHIDRLGFENSEHYFDWCWENGFDGTIEKSKTDLQDELEAFATSLEKKAKQHRLHKNPKAFLKAACSGKITSDEIDRPNFKRAVREIEASNESEAIRESLLAMLLALLKEKDLLFETTTARGETPYIRGLIKIHDRKTLWLRPLEKWKPKSNNSLKKFGELTHYLFDQYGDVPVFMEAVWLRTDRPSWRYRDWFVHLGRGYNLRTAKSPIPITKKMAHHFQQAPHDYTVEQAIRWAQLKALGASENAINACVATRICRSFENEDFWFTVLRFIARNPMLDPRQIGPLIDYLHNQKFVPVEMEVALGEWRQLPPPQPGLSMSGRTVITLMRQVAAWHDDLGRIQNLSNAAYAAPAFKGTVIKKRNGSQTIRWIIRQLRSAGELQKESEELNHCVASYHWSCMKGQCTIWSLSFTIDGHTHERRQTIEVSKDGTIVQCRGLANRDPNTEEWSIITAWADQSNLDVSTYL